MRHFKHAVADLLFHDAFCSAMNAFRTMQDFLSAFQRKAHPVARVNDPHGRAAFIFE